MSELSKCNYCTLKRMREKAARRNATVVLSKDLDTHWTTARYSDRDVPSASFMVLTERCCC